MAPAMQFGSCGCSILRDQLLEKRLEPKKELNFASGKVLAGFASWMKRWSAPPDFANFGHQSGRFLQASPHDRYDKCEVLVWNLNLVVMSIQHANIEVGTIPESDLVPCSNWRHWLAHGSALYLDIGPCGSFKKPQARRRPPFTFDNICEIIPSKVVAHWVELTERILVVPPECDDLLRHRSFRFFQTSFDIPRKMRIEMAAARRPPDRPRLIYDPPEPRRDRAQPGREGAGLERMPECEVHMISDIAIGMLPPKEIATGRSWSFMTFPDRARGIIVDAIEVERIYFGSAIPYSATRLSISAVRIEDTKPVSTWHWIGLRKRFRAIC